jgi:formate hydrogenlyase subunit 6/NADH:ubiquinone oxidoreductase subunit I
VHPTSTGERYAAMYEINMIRCIFCGYCEEACPVDAIRLGPEYELADYTRADFVYTKQMLLDPEKFAPPRQYHADVDQTDPELKREIPYDEDLGEVYRQHRPLTTDH